MRVVLASRSPRRRALLAQIGVSCEVLAADIAETRQPGESVEHLVERLARDKAEAVAAKGRDGAIVVGADTVVTLENEALGKPADEAEAERMLERLSGRAHEVLTAVAVVAAARTTVRLSRTRVWFRQTSAEERRAYAASGEPMDKAGAYAIQGNAARFVERIDGSYSGVMGLPLFETAALLSEAAARGGGAG